METSSQQLGSPDLNVYACIVIYILRILRETSSFCFRFREEVEDFFARMDRDFDGRLSFEEFMGEESPIEKLFKNMDKNGDGFVTKQVFS